MDSPKPATGATRIKPGRRTSLRQVIDFQQIAHEAAQGLRADFTGTQDRDERARVASAIANLGKSWCSLQDSKREILGRPKAGVLKPESAKARQRRHQARDLSLEEVAASMRREPSGSEEVDSKSD